MPLVDLCIFYWYLANRGRLRAEINPAIHPLKENIPLPYRLILLDFLSYLSLYILQHSFIAFWWLTFYTLINRCLRFPFTSHSFGHPLINTFSRRVISSALPVVLPVARQAFSQYLPKRGKKAQNHILVQAQNIIPPFFNVMPFTTADNVSPPKSIEVLSSKTTVTRKIRFSYQFSRITYPTHDRRTWSTHISKQSVPHPPVSHPFA